MEIITHRQELNEKLDRHGFDAGVCRSRGTSPGGQYHDGIELIVVHAGGVEVQVERDSYLIGPERAILFPATRAHFTRPLQGFYRRSVLHFLADMACATPVPHLVHRVGREGANLVVDLDREGARRIRWAMAELSRISRAGGLRYGEAQALMGVVFATLNAGAASTVHPDQRLVAEVIEYMQAHLDRCGNLSELAARFHISQSHLRMIFARHVGEAPARYWLRLRMARARHLLANGVPIADAAALVGFTTRRGFERAFRATFGVTPGSPLASLIQEGKR